MAPETMNRRRTARWSNCVAYGSGCSRAEQGSKLRTKQAKRLFAARRRTLDRPLRCERAGQKASQEALSDLDELEKQAANYRGEVNRHAAKGYEEYKEVILALEKQIAVIDREIAETKAMIDQIGGQRGCSVSRLYWYTDFDAAKAAATKTGRPILSLRMLGKLTDEYSCANSRFFRTALYSNKEISDYLRNNFVLHWQSVRPVPRVTIDFGDGRKLERTLTGNSAHYVLAANGQPLDVLPGLYGPQAFREWLERMQSFHGSYARGDDTARAKMLEGFHVRMHDALLQRWGRDIQRLGEEKSSLVSLRISEGLAAAQQAGEKVPDPNHAPNAKVAALRAVGKSFVEAPVLRFANLGGRWIEQGMDEQLWEAIAALHREEVQLDEASVDVMRQEFPQAPQAGRLAVAKRAQEDPVLRVVRMFEKSIALDTVRNEYLLHRRIHEKFFENDPLVANVDSLNEWVYAELFLTPSSDPWLGLAPNDIYTALDRDGRTEPWPEPVRRQ